MKYLSENKNTCFEVIYKGEKKQLLEVMKGRYFQSTNPLKETIDLVASVCLDDWFSEKYPKCLASRLRSPFAILRRLFAQALTDTQDARASRPMRCWKASAFWTARLLSCRNRSMPSTLSRNWTRFPGKRRHQLQRYLYRGVRRI